MNRKGFTPIVLLLVAVGVLVVGGGIWFWKTHSLTQLLTYEDCIMAGGEHGGIGNAWCKFNGQIFHGPPQEELKTSSQQGSSTVDTSNWKTYSNTQSGGFSVMYPPNWYIWPSDPTHTPIVISSVPKSNWDSAFKVTPGSASFSIYSALCPNRNDSDFRNTFGGGPIRKILCISDFNLNLEYIPSKNQSTKDEKYFQATLNAVAKSFRTITPDTSNWKTYRNQQYGFSLKYPPNLVINESTSSAFADYESMDEASTSFLFYDPSLEPTCIDFENINGGSLCGNDGYQFYIHPIAEKDSWLNGQGYSLDGQPDPDSGITINGVTSLVFTTPSNIGRASLLYFPQKTFFLSIFQMGSIGFYGSSTLTSILSTTHY